MGDLPIEELGNKTPLEAADTPNMDFLAKTGKTGLMYSVRKGVAPESDVAGVAIMRASLHFLFIFAYKTNKKLILKLFQKKKYYLQLILR